MQVGVKTLQRLPVQEIVFFRALIILFIAWFMIKRKGLSPFGNNKLFLLLRGLTGAVALLLFFYILQQIPLATAVTLQYLSPIFTILFAGVIMKESASWRQWLAFIIAMGGVILVKGFDPRISMLNLAFGLASAMFSGLAYNFIRKLKDYDDPDVIVFYFPLVTIPVVFPFLLTSWVWPSGWEWLVLLFVGVCTLIAQMAMTRAYQLEKASDVIIFKYLGIIFALAFGYLLFGEVLQPLSLVGIVIVVAGVLLGSWGRGAIRHIGPSAES